MKVSVFSEAPQNGTYGSNENVFPRHQSVKVASADRPAGFLAVRDVKVEEAKELLTFAPPVVVGGYSSELPRRSLFLAIDLPACPACSFLGIPGQDHDYHP